MRRSIIPSSQLSKESRDLYKVLNKEDDVPCVVVAAAFLDAAVASLIAEFMLRKSATAAKLLSPNGPLGGFQTRIDVGYCLGLIRKEHYQELCIVAKVRNQFAHSHLHLSFADEQIREWCDELAAWKDIFPEHSPPTPMKHPRRLQILARNKFTMSVVTLSQRLILDALSYSRLDSVKYPRWRQMKQPAKP